LINKQGLSLPYFKHQCIVSADGKTEDVQRGQSLIIWAISEGREAAHHIDSYLIGTSQLPLKDVNNDLLRR
jgi:phage gp36-like protein